MHRTHMYIGSPTIVYAFLADLKNGMRLGKEFVYLFVTTKRGLKANVNKTKVPDLR